jgi:hypothetical protein
MLPFTRYDPIVIEFTDWAARILSRSFEAARRFNPDARLRLSRKDGDVEFSITDEQDPTDRLVEGESFSLYVAEGLEGIVDVVEPHDRLVLRPPGSPERSVPHDPRPAGDPRAGDAGAGGASAHRSAESSAQEDDVRGSGG